MLYWASLTLTNASHAIVFDAVTISITILHKAIASTDMHHGGYAENVDCGRSFFRERKNRFDVGEPELYPSILMSSLPTTRVDGSCALLFATMDIIRWPVLAYQIMICATHAERSSLRTPPSLTLIISYLSHDLHILHVPTLQFLCACFNQQQE